MADVCLYCKEKLRGRVDKKFCNSDCRNSYNNQKNSDKNNSMRNINNRLRKNRRIIEELIPENEELTKVHRDKLVKLGFNFTYFTHVYTTQKGKKYHFIYDKGYLDLGEDWFLLVHRDPKF